MLQKNFNNSLVAAAFVWMVLTYFKPSLTAFWVGAVTLSYPVPEMFASLLIWPFVHYHFFHFLTNAFLLLYFWNPLEREVGSRKYFAFFAFSTVLISVTLLALEYGRAVVGLDAFAMAVCAYTIVRMKENRHPELPGAYVFVAIFLGLDFIGGYGFLGNLAGLLAGVSFRLWERFLTKKR